LSHGTLLRSISPPPKAALNYVTFCLCMGAIARRNAICVT
jgi:hypothetical protein